MNKAILKKQEFSYGMTEEMNRLRTSILFAGIDVKVILITSAVSAEGKTTVCFNVANSLMELGKRILYLDNDLRKTATLKSVSMPPDWHGVTHYLSGQCELADAIYNLEGTNLDICLSGPIPPSSTKLLSGERYRNMFKMLRNAYDYIIVDTPPIGMVVDAEIIAKECDASILLIESAKLHAANARVLKEKLVSAGCPFLGVILNKVEYSKSGYYGYGKYGKYGHYGYGKYGKYGYGKYGYGKYENSDK